MWINKDKWLEMELRVRRLEERGPETMLRDDLFDGDRIFLHYGMPANARVPVVDIVRRLVDHLGLRIIKTPDQKGSVCLEPQPTHSPSPAPKKASK